MAYIPNNADIFVAAYSGTLAGMASSYRVVTDPTPADYASLAAVAGNFAQAFDTAWGANPANSLQVEMAQEVCGGAWQERTPQTSPIAPPSQFLSWCQALVAVIQAGSTYFVGQAIIPPGWNTGAPGPPGPPGPSTDVTPFGVAGALPVLSTVYVSAADTVALANASAIGTMPVVGIIVSILGLVVQVQKDGAIPGFAGLVPGAVYFQSSTTPGGITTVVPALPGQIVQRLGYAKDATTFVAEIDTNITVL